MVTPGGGGKGEGRLRAELSCRSRARWAPRIAAWSWASEALAGPCLAAACCLRRGGPLAPSHSAAAPQGSVSTSSDSRPHDKAVSLPPQTVAQVSGAEAWRPGRLLPPMTSAADLGLREGAGPGPGLGQAGGQRAACQEFPGGALGRGQEGGAGAESWGRNRDPSQGDSRASCPWPQPLWAAAQRQPGPPKPTGSVRALVPKSRWGPPPRVLPPAAGR